MNKNKPNPKVILWFSIIVILLLVGTSILGILNLIKDNRVDKELLWHHAKNIKGNKDSNIQVVVFNDYNCSHCYQFNKEIQKNKLKEYIDKGDIAYSTVNYPIVDQRSIYFAHMDNIISKNVNNDIYWIFHNKAYNVQTPDDALNFLNISKGLKQKIRNDYDDIKNTPYQTKDLEKSFNVSQTPTIFVNGVEVENKNQLIKTIDKLKK